MEPVDEYLESSYAPTSRAGCRGCKEKIEKGLLRLSLITDFGDGNMLLQHHFHVECFKLKKSLIGTVTEKKIEGIDELSKQDREIIERKIKEIVSGGQNKQKKPAKERGTKKSGKKQKTATKSSDDEELQKQLDEMILESDKKKRAPLKSQTQKKVKKSEDGEGSDQAPEKKTKAQPKKAAQHDSSDSSESDKDSVDQYQAYTDEQKKEYKKQRKELQSKTMAQLKDMLKKNDQKCTGTKPELVARIADGRVLGAIPRCASCSGGRPAFNPKNGKYRCPGYMEDTVFIHCNVVSAFKDIERMKWIN